MPIKIIMLLFAALGLVMGIMFYGKSYIKQAMSGMFFGFCAGCLLIAILG